MANMEYRFSESAYVGQASNGTMVRVDESEFAETVRDGLRYDGVSLDAPDYAAKYQEVASRLMDADSWVGLIGENPNVTADE